jgi:hypothetical protein
VDLIQRVALAVEESLGTDFTDQCLLRQLRQSPFQEPPATAGAPVAFTEVYIAKVSEDYRDLYRGVFRVMWTQGPMVYVSMRDTARLIHRDHLVMLPHEPFRVQVLEP